MERGWIKVYRMIQDNRHWNKKPFSSGQVMIDLLLRATHKPHKKAVGYKTIHLEPGQFFTSIRNLAADWGWTRKKVCNLLDALENENFLERKGTEKGTTYTIVNWTLFQGLGDTKGTQRGHLQEYKNIYKGEFFSVTEINHRKYKEAYPGLDLVGEYRKMDAWLQSNPGKRKTERGYPRFVNNWLSTAYADTKGKQPGDWIEQYPIIPCE